MMKTFLNLILVLVALAASGARAQLPEPGARHL